MISVPHEQLPKVRKLDHKQTTDLLRRAQTHRSYLRRKIVLSETQLDPAVREY